MALTTKRIIALPSQTDPQEGDYLAIDNAQGGTHKIPVGSVGVEVDDTLTEQGKAADAKAVGDALDEIRSQAEATDDAIDEIRSQVEVTGTASGAIATFTDGAEMPAKSVIVNIAPKQSGSGTPSPDNVRPISGWTEVNVIVSPTQEATDGTTKTVNLGRTVYGGTLDVVSGVLTVDKGFATFDGSSDETWFNNGSVGVYTPKASLPNVKPVWSGVTILSNQYTQAVSGQAPTVNGKFNWNDSMSALQFRNDNALSATDFRAALAQNPVTFVYPLATPQTYQLTPTEIQTLLGENNVWADSGDVGVVYVRDLNIAINNLLNRNGTRSLGMMAMSAPTEATAEEPADEQTEEPAEDDMR